MLQFGCWNINGFNSQKFDNVVGVVETWTKVSQASPFLDLQLCMRQM
jgi:hypothetical protein